MSCECCVSVGPHSIVFVHLPTRQCRVAQVALALSFVYSTPTLNCSTFFCAVHERGCNVWTQVAGKLSNTVESENLVPSKMGKRGQAIVAGDTSRKKRKLEKKERRKKNKAELGDEV